MRTERRRRAFTLVEILVVLAIAMLVAIIALPVIGGMLHGRQVNAAARLLTATLAGAKDAAIRANETRGVRLLPDLARTTAAFGNPRNEPAGQLQLCYDRLVPIEPAADYSEGRVTIGPAPDAIAMQQMVDSTNPKNVFPPFYPRAASSGGRYPYFASGFGSQVLMVEESPFSGGYAATVSLPNNPVNWYWNIRVGDKIRIQDSGRWYTIVGPCVNSPWTTGDNADLFVNIGPADATSQLQRTFRTVQTDPTGTIITGYQDLPPPSGLRGYPVQFLFVVDGEDNNTNGYVDEGWDGYDNNANSTATQSFIDELSEWEPEVWHDAAAAAIPFDPGDGSGKTPSLAWGGKSPWWPAIGSPVVNLQVPAQAWDRPYAIQRRPVPTPGAREIRLPEGVTIDATTWNTTQERSRLPVQPGSLTCDLMFDPTGLFIPTTAYSTPISQSAMPVLHFWLTDVGDVYPDGTLWGTTTQGNMTLGQPNPTAGHAYRLPMPKGTWHYQGGTYLEHNRLLVTLFAQSGLVTTSPVENGATPATASTSLLTPPEGFSGDDVNQPYYAAQQGQRGR